MNKRHYEHTLPNIRGSLSNTYTRHKITKTLVQDSADLVPSFTGYCSSVHLFSSDSIFFLYFHSSTIHFSILRVSALKFTPILKSFRLSEAKGSA